MTRRNLNFHYFLFFKRRKLIYFLAVLIGKVLYFFLSVRHVVFGYGVGLFERLEFFYGVAAGVAYSDLALLCGLAYVLYNFLTAFLCKRRERKPYYPAVVLRVYADVRCEYRFFYILSVEASHGCIIRIRGSGTETAAICCIGVGLP